MSKPLAYFLSWTCYGTWLHGDARGSADDLHNVRGTPYLAPDPARQRHEAGLMKHDPVTLSSEARRLVEETIRAHCEIRQWRLLAVNVRSNHLHFVVDCDGRIAPEDAMEQFKAWATRKLRERAFWTEHGSTRWINHEAGLLAAIDYVLNRQ